jgi:transposase
MDLRDRLGPVYTDQAFAPLFSPLGQPAVPPWRLVLISILQFVEGLTDAQAADAVRSRVEWKYLLGLELTDPGFHYSVLSEFRARLIAGGLEQELLDSLLAACQAQGWIHAGGTQRTDATHVLGAIRAMNRLESSGETLRAALNALAVAAPNWLVEQVAPDWFDRYSRRIEEYRLPKGDTARAAYASTIGTDGANLLAAIYAPTAPAWLRQIPAVELLRRMWVQQFYAPDAAGQIHWRKAADLPPAALWLHSPYDAEVRYGTKRSTNWVG